MGIIRIYPKSEAILESIPVKTIKKVTEFLGALLSNRFIDAFISPLLSAIPIPSIATITMPKGAKPM